MWETTLIESAKAGNLEAYDALIERCLPEIRAFVAFKAPASHLVDELTHESFVFAYYHLSDFRVGTSFRAWVKAIANNMLRKEIQRYARDKVNRERYSRFRDMMSKTGDTVQPQDETEEVDALRECLGKMPEKSQKIIDLKYRKGISAVRVANLVGRSEDWVYQNLHRIRIALRDCIRKRLNVEPA